MQLAASYILSMFVTTHLIGIHALGFLARNFIYGCYVTIPLQ